MTDKKNVLVIGSGGREHALVWKLEQSNLVDKVYCAPGNGGISLSVPIGIDDFEGLAAFVNQNNIDLTVVGPEVPLVDGIVDYFQERELRIFGPNKKAAQLEGSKVYAKEFMTRHGIPTAPFEVFSDPGAAEEYIRQKGAPIVVKADGLAAGKGAIVCPTIDDAINAVDLMMVQKKFKRAGDKVVIEDFMPGEEASIMALTDGETIVSLISSQDHKPVGEGDTGPNTGGMGAYAPAPVVTPGVMKKIYDNILFPTIAGMNKEGMKYVGCLYVGLMIQNNTPRVVEYNIRFGDPEAQPVLHMLENDLYGLMNACVEGNLNQHEIRNKEGAACCVVMASGGYPGSYEKGKLITGLDAAAAMDNVHVFHAGTRLEDGEIRTNGGRVVGVLGVGGNIRNAIDHSYNGVNAISFEKGFSRPDIGGRALNRGK